MGHFRYSFLVAMALAAGSAMGAQAADFRFPPAPVVPVPAPIPIPDYSAWYLRGDIAWSFHEDPDLTQLGASFSGEEMDETWSIGAGFGHYFSDKIRGDVTVDYRLFADVTGFDTVTGTTRAADLSSTAGLANLYFDIRGREDFSPYVGAGLGFSYNEADSETKLDFAAAAMAGFSYRLHEGWLLDAGYRFLYLGDAETNANGAAGALHIDGIYAHELRAGFRYELN